MSKLNTHHENLLPVEDVEPRYHLVFASELPEVIIKKTYVQFRMKIFNNQKECKLSRANFDRVEPDTLQFLVEVDNSMLLQLQMRLIIETEEGIFVAGREQDPVNVPVTTPSPVLKHSFSSDSMIRINNPVFGKSAEILKKGVVSPKNNRANDFLQLHQTTCPACETHKPCPRSKYRGINVIQETNELQFYIRILAPITTSKSKSIVLKPFLQNNQSINKTDIDRFASAKQMAEIAKKDISEVDFVTPEDSYQLFISLLPRQQSRRGHVMYYRHCLSPPIFISDCIHPNTFGIDFFLKFHDLLMMGLSDQLQFELLEFQQKLHGDNKEDTSVSLSGDYTHLSLSLRNDGEADATLYIFIRKYLHLVDVYHLLRRTDDIGGTILHYASSLGYNLLIDLLLSENERRGKGPADLAVVNIADINNRTPLHFAALVDHRSCVVCLLAHHAACSRKDINGHSALFYARSVGAIEVAKLIKRWSQVRETQILISSLSMEKEKLEQQIASLQQQATEITQKKEKAKRPKRKSSGSTPPATVQRNPLFGRKTPTKSMQHGELKLKDGQPVFTPIAKSKSKSGSSDSVKRKKKELPSSTRQREHELRATLEQERMRRDLSLFKLKALSKHVKRTNRDPTDTTRTELRSVISILEGNHAPYTLKDSQGQPVPSLPQTLISKRQNRLSKERISGISRLRSPPGESAPSLISMSDNSVKPIPFNGLDSPEVERKGSSNIARPTELLTARSSTSDSSNSNSYSSNLSDHPYRIGPQHRTNSNTSSSTSGSYTHSSISSDASPRMHEGPKKIQARPLKNPLRLKSGSGMRDKHYRSSGGSSKRDDEKLESSEEDLILTEPVSPRGNNNNGNPNYSPSSNRPALIPALITRHHSPSAALVSHLSSTSQLDLTHMHTNKEPSSTGNGSGIENRSSALQSVLNNVKGSPKSTRNANSSNHTNNNNNSGSKNINNTSDSSFHKSLLILCNERNNSTSNDMAINNANNTSNILHSRYNYNLNKSQSNALSDRGDRFNKFKKEGEKDEEDDEGGSTIGRMRYFSRTTTADRKTRVRLLRRLSDSSMASWELSEDHLPIPRKFTGSPSPSTLREVELFDPEEPLEVEEEQDSQEMKELDAEQERLSAANLTELYEKEKLTSNYLQLEQIYTQSPSAVDLPLPLTLSSDVGSPGSLSTASATHRHYSSHSSTSNSSSTSSTIAELHRMSDADLHDYLTSRNALNEITFKTNEKGSRTVQYASLRVIIDYLVDKNNSTQLLDTFLLMYRNFTSPSGLLDSLLHKWSTSFLTTPFSPSTTPQSPLTQRRIIYILRRWMDRYFVLDFKHDIVLIEKVLQFLNTMVECGFQDLSASLRSVIELSQTKETAIHNLELAMSPRVILPKDLLRAESRKKLKDTKKIEFLDIHPIELVRQLTLIEIQLFKDIKAIDCVRFLKQTGNGAIPTCEPLVTRFNQVSRWVATEIVLTANLRKRTYVLRRFIRLAEECLKINNFNSLLEILSGINNFAVQRLKRTWKGLPNKSREKFEEMERLMENRCNYAVYRKKLEECKSASSVFPYFGVFLRDITFADVGNENFVHQGNKKLINFEKLFIIHKLISEMERFQLQTYNFQEVPQITNFLHNLLTLPDETLYYHSLLCEPSTQEL